MSKKLFTKARPFDKQPSNAHGNLEEHGARSLCSIPWWIILLVCRFGSSQPYSLKTQSRILRYLTLQTKKIFQSCDKTTKLLDHNLYFVAYTSMNNGNQPIFFSMD